MAASKAMPKRSSRASASRSIGLATEASGGSCWRSTSAIGRRQRAELEPLERRAVGADHAGTAGIGQDQRPPAEALREAAERLGGDQQPAQALDPDDAARGAEGVDRRIVVGDRAGMRGRGAAADVGAAAEQGDHRLGRGDLARQRAEALVILDRFDIEQRRADLRPLAQPGEIVLDAEMHRIADRHDRGERQAARIGLVDELLGERAGLRDEGEPVRRPAAAPGGRSRRKVAAKRQAGSRWTMPAQFGPATVTPRSAASFSSASLRATPAGPASAKPPGRMRTIADAAIGALADRVEDGVGPDHDHGKVDRRIDGGDRGHRVVTEYVPPLGLTGTTRPP